MDYQDSYEDSILAKVTLDRLLEQLTEEEREIMYLLHQKDLSPEQVGEIIGIKYRNGEPLREGTIRYHDKRIKAKLRALAGEST
jgi:DNA-directed RNA polymerase specialized sigma24 family protein